MKTFLFREHELRTLFADGRPFFLVTDILTMTGAPAKGVYDVLLRLDPKQILKRAPRELGLHPRGQARSLVDSEGFDTILRAMGWPYASLCREWLMHGCPEDFDVELRSAPTLSERLLGILDNLPASMIDPSAREVLRAAIQEPEP